MKSRSLIVVCLVTLGCDVGPTDPNSAGSQGRLAYGEDGALAPTSIPSTGQVPLGCVRIEGGQVGQAGVVVPLGGDFSVTFTSWKKKQGESEEIGFSYEASGGAVALASMPVGAGAGSRAGQGLASR